MTPQPTSLPRSTSPRMILFKTQVGTHSRSRLALIADRDAQELLHRRIGVFLLAPAPGPRGELVADLVKEEAEEVLRINPAASRATQTFPGA